MSPFLIINPDANHIGAKALKPSTSKMLWINANIKKLGNI
jgi:hypothetical protein